MNNIKRDLLELDTICGRLSSINSVFSLILTAYEQEEAATRNPNNGIVNGFGLCERELQSICDDMTATLNAWLKGEQQ